MTIADTAIAENLADSGNQRCCGYLDKGNFFFSE